MNCVRGIRNNNPANIRHGSAWKGLSPVQADPSFCQFITMSYGIRAFFALMRTYRNKYNLLSVRDILYRFAPSNENDTEAYISFVCKFIRDHGFVNCGDDGTFLVNIWHNQKNPSEFLRVFARAVFEMETGFPFLEIEIDRAVDLL